MDFKIIKENKLLWVIVLFIVGAVIFYKISTISPLKEIILLLSIVLLILYFIFKVID